MICCQTIGKPWNDGSQTAANRTYIKGDKDIELYFHTHKIKKESPISDDSFSNVRLTSSGDSSLKVSRTYRLTVSQRYFSSHRYL